MKLFILVAAEESQVACLKARDDLSIIDYSELSIEQKYGLIKLLGAGTVPEDNWEGQIERFWEEYL